ncbi:hypothetical protein LTR08_004603 [Meristemomyces frigidus]|nr:hypothetical protein LTR08_004603 [Meristemomyces frigidus]
MGEPQYMSYPRLALAQSVFALASPSTAPAAKHTALDTLQHAIRDLKMAPLYHYLAHPQTGTLNPAGESASSPAAATHAAPTHMLRRTSSIHAPGIVGVLGGKTDVSVALPWDEALYAELVADNEKELVAIQKEEDDAAERAGDVEVLAAQAKRAELYARIGDKDLALDEFEKLLEKTGILGTKIDIVLAQIRIALFFDDKPLVKKHVALAAALVASGGDWDRRNRLKAYQGLHLLTIRAHNLAAPLLLDSLSTFTSTELCSYSELVVYATLAGSVSLPRRDFKTKVVDAPEIRAVFGAENESDRLSALAGSNSSVPSTAKPAATATPTPKTSTTTTATSSSTPTEPAAPTLPTDFTPLSTLTTSLYQGNYTPFFTSLASVEASFLSTDRYLFEHKAWFVREMRLRAYTQLLSSYRTVGLESMAKSFGVGVEWLDRDLAVFIAGGRLAVRVDRVGGVVEMVGGGSGGGGGGRDGQYNEVIKQGDQLITKLQKYGQVVRLRGSERS